jgi:hypothetical protein
MNEIKCPKCHEVFKVDEAGYAEIAKQVRDHHFEEELRNRLDLAEKDKNTAVQLAQAEIKNSLQLEISNKEKEIIALKAQSEKQLTEQLAAKDQMLQSLTRISSQHATIQKRRLEDCKTT